MKEDLSNKMHNVSFSPFSTHGASLSSKGDRAGMRFIIAGGGTGGHIFPAIAIANALKKIDAQTEILFVGAEGKMEMEKVPQAGYKIKGIDIAGFNRSSLIKNFGLPFKLLKSFFQVRSIVDGFRPDAVIGVGGYSSFPVLRYAQTKGIPTFIHESNSFAGKSNMLLSKKATKVFVATDGMERFFPAEKLMITGNPVRKSIVEATMSKRDALSFFGFGDDRQTVLVVGGSLGAKSINEAIDLHLDDLLNSNLQVIWQTGKPYAQKAKDRAAGKQHVWVSEFITQMETAYAAADIVVSRAGAMAVSELSLVKKPVVFVPYPFAAEDHQTANAMNLVNKRAALMVKDSEAIDKVVPAIVELSKNQQGQDELKQNIARLAVSNADIVVAEEIVKTIK
ncbi:undecaprenyldiphospho-muramoylpentapeptide beta-N-acetylglucosaminyltransferase [Chitinophagaceae bacterium LB-8]|uniref:UDP-N-acetylglucosamine--N-acetylmuramyl-(pentapeptide) pyrophosphoryl-undecaprenol N-acetylglucosamine transferase n=1 Tax=Paraflavisolibacter caeni TaxID=2982496 RepID=A0A9X2XS20_9BACT|nr:undecaprenyldiphospho-muramoylpentapeptide beta-N-acetylglucosaminyltransferase [Paraflavisolibacter caeni]MCU7547751.1 undecaprenyldiphospho-muramoylpentapeptide beta-N-acetylglucosaminyltransferase [Paraflavisolibacter caeni]